MGEKIIISESNKKGTKIWLERIGDSECYELKTNKNDIFYNANIVFTNVSSETDLFDFDLNGNKVICKSYEPNGGPVIQVNKMINKKYFVKRIYKDYSDGLIKVIL